MSTPRTTPTRQTPRLLALGLATALAAALISVAGLGATEAATAATGTPIPDGAYLESPWVVPGGNVHLDLVGDGCTDESSATFVDSRGTRTVLPSQGVGDTYWPVRTVGFVNATTSAPLTIGAKSAVSGHLLVACVTSSGSAGTTYSLPLIVSSTAPSSIYHSATAWTYYTAGALVAGAQVTVNALGFQPGESTTVSLADSTMFAAGDGSFTGDVATSVTTIADGEGAVTAQVTLPAGWSSTDIVDALVAGASSRYLLVSGQGTPLHSDPSLSLASNVSAFPGGAVSVSAAGYEPNETVTIGLHSATARALDLGTLTADSNGKLSGSVYVPSGIATGQYRIWAGAKVISYLVLNSPLTLGTAPTTSRTSGADRFATAVATSQSFAPYDAADDSGTDTVYLASGAAFPDALGAGALAAEVHAPVLLTNSLSLPDSIRTELERLHPLHVKVVGGTSAVSDAVYHDVAGLDFDHDIERIGGADRFATNRLLITDARQHASTVYVATAYNFPDALAAGPAAAKANGAVVLVNGSAASLDSATLGLLSGLGVTQVRLVGGAAAISSGIQNQLAGIYGSGVTRIAGADRYDTAAQIVAQAWPTTAPQVILASGTNFPDALAAGALGLPMLTSAPTCIPATTLAELGNLQASSLTLVGGTAALSAGVATFQHC